MKKLFHAVLLSAAVISGLTACDRSAKETESGGPVIAKVGKIDITQKDFQKEISHVPDWAREQFGDEEGKKKFLEELIKRELIYLDAKKMKLDNDKEYVEHMKDFEKRTLVSLVLKKEIDDKATVSDADVKNYYDQNKDKFVIGTQIRASHILVQTEKEANDISNRLAKGESFAELARSKSIDKGSAEKGGDLGYFEQGRMVPEFEQAIMSLKPGETSKPVKTRFGYHIIKLIELKKGQQASFEQSAEAIRKQLTADKKKEAFDAYIEKLKKENKVERNDKEIAALTLPWNQPGKGETPPPGH